jgi:hypothetical protein
MYAIPPFLFLFNQFSNLGASSSKNWDLEIPQAKKPRRFASDLMNSVYLDF